MELQNISKLIELQGLTIVGINCDTNEIVVNGEPIEHKQNCPCCKSSEIIRNGKDGYKKIRHLPIAGKKCVIVVPKIRLKCKCCNATYAHEYEIVSGKQRYTKAYKEQIYTLAIGSTVQHTAEVTTTPYTTAERLFKEIVLRLAPITEEYVQKIAQETQKLILGIDDFAIRKGHNYNTGIHDLRGESLIGIIQGRRIEELRAYMVNNPRLLALKPYAIVMDLAKGYHAFATEFFPEAIRIADRFHVNGYIIEALNDTQRRVSKEFSPQARIKLKRHKHLLNRRKDSLKENEVEMLHSLLRYSDELKAAYEYKERLIDWYDCSFSYESAKIGFQRWCAIGHGLHIPEIDNALKTFENWQTEIINYHRCRFTNGIVEGRNGKIKSLQRRRYFLQNRTFYESLIILECNKYIAQDQFRQAFA